MHTVSLLVGGFALAVICFCASGLLGVFRSKPKPLTPDICQCGHFRCVHTNGNYGCNQSFPAGHNAFKEESVCDCDVFIKQTGL